MLPFTFCLASSTRLRGKVGAMAHDRDLQSAGSTGEALDGKASATRRGFLPLPTGSYLRKSWTRGVTISSFSAWERWGCVRVGQRHVRVRGGGAEKADLRTLAEAHGNRTHLGTPSRPYTGFEGVSEVFTRLFLGFHLWAPPEGMRHTLTPLSGGLHHAGQSSRQAR